MIRIAVLLVLVENIQSECEYLRSERKLKLSFFSSEMCRKKENKNRKLSKK